MKAGAAPAPETWDKVARIVAFSAIVPLALLVAPVLTTQLIAERGLTPADVGDYFLFELGGISLASLPALWWLRRVAARQIAPGAAGLCCASTPPAPRPIAIGCSAGGSPASSFWARSGWRCCRGCSLMSGSMPFSA